LLVQGGAPSLLGVSPKRPIDAMRRVLIPMILAAALVHSDAAAQEAAGQVETATADRESRSLFDGKTLSGWQIYGTEHWFVEEGTLVCESGPNAEYGYLATDEVFGDFDLTLEFLQEADGNSGVFFRSWVTGTVVSGWQVEVAPPGAHSGGIYESYGRGWLVQPDEEGEAALRPGEWNAMRIRAVGGHVQTWLNGTPIVDLTDDTIGEARGRIALQIHSGGGIRVRWREIRIETL
jgi:3-keto-disaccharide hydrolase